MGGNIGVPILALEPPVKDRIYVIEMSSFQIDLTPSLNPTIGVLLNITPDHIDRHGTVENYIEVKRRLLVGSKTPIIGEDEVCQAIYQNYPADLDNYLTLSSTFSIYGHGRFVDGCIYSGPIPIMGQAADVRGYFIADLNEVASLRGTHNAQNAWMAYLALKSLVPSEVIAQHMRTYPGMPHRLEEIGRVGNVLFINDSKATNADSTEKALLSFPDGVYWILGGKPKEGGIEPLVPLFPAVMKAYLIGAATEDFAKTLEGHVPFERCGTLDAAVAAAARDAASTSGNFATPAPNPSPQGGGESPASSLPPVGRAGVGQTQPVVLLSPACASYDQFKSFEHRGDAFRALVTALPGFAPRGKA